MIEPPRSFDVECDLGYQNLIVSGCSFTKNFNKNCVHTWPYYLRDLGGFKNVWDSSCPGAGNNHIARSIINTPNPNIILMDELEAALDGIIYKKIYDFLMDYPCNKIISTHDGPTMMAMDYLIVLDIGKIVGQGTPSECLSNNTFNAIINSCNNE